MNSYEESREFDREEITVGDEGYPKGLLDLRYPPQTLRVLGNASLLSGETKLVAFAGGEQPTPSSGYSAQRLVDTAVETGLPIALLADSDYGISGEALGRWVYRAEMAKGLYGMPKMDVRPPVVFLSQGIDRYLADEFHPTIEHALKLGGAVVSPEDWDAEFDSNALRRGSTDLGALADYTVYLQVSMTSLARERWAFAETLRRPAGALPGAFEDRDYAGSIALIENGCPCITSRLAFSDALEGLFGKEAGR